MPAHAVVPESGAHRAGIDPATVGVESFVVRWARPVATLSVLVFCAGASWTLFVGNLATTADLKPIVSAVGELQTSVGELKQQANSHRAFALEESDCMVEKLEFRRLSAEWRRKKRGASPGKSPALLDCEKAQARRIAGHN